jgi:[acyl-carrier-protein] S-malonyltransferase
VFGIRRVKYLPVSGAFHTPLMGSAKLKVIKALEKIDLQPPLIQVMSNVTGKRHSSEPMMIKRFLSQQLTKSVQWEQIVHHIYQRSKRDLFPNTFECGPGRQLGYLLRLNNNRAYQKYRHIDI